MICILAPARVGLNTSRDRIFPQPKLGNIRDYPFLLLPCQEMPPLQTIQVCPNRFIFWGYQTTSSTTCPVSLEMVTERLPNFNVIRRDCIKENARKNVPALSRSCVACANLASNSYARWTRCDCSNRWVKIQSQVKGMFRHFSIP